VTFTLNCPGVFILITPPHEQLHIAVLGRAGKPLILVLNAPGAQGPTGTGTQGIGVNTPSAAAVADATAGFSREVHIPKGGIFTSGAKSMMVAAGKPPTVTGGPFGTTINELGVNPKGTHWSEAPIQVSGGIVHLLLQNY
jgi:hypothetical protein